jgi:hypothetical protein
LLLVATSRPSFLNVGPFLHLRFMCTITIRFFTKMSNSYLCNQLGNALFCVTSGIFAGRAQRDPAKSQELHKIAFPNVLHTRFFLILTKKKFLQTLNEVMNFINNKLLLC